MVFWTVHKVLFTATQICLHVQKKRRYLDKGICHAWDISGASLRGGVHVCYRLGYVPEAELSLPAGKAFLSTVSSCTVSHCKVPAETCRGWVGGSEPCECHCLAGGNHIFSISQLVCSGSGFCPISSLMAIRETSNEYLSLKLPMKLLLAAGYYLSLAHHHQLTVPRLPVLYFQCQWCNGSCPTLTPFAFRFTPTGSLPLS